MKTKEEIVAWNKAQYPDLGPEEWDDTDMFEDFVSSQKREPKDGKELDDFVNGEGEFAEEAE